MKKFLLRICFAFIFFSLGVVFTAYYYENLIESDAQSKNRPAHQLNTVLKDIKQKPDTDKGFFKSMVVAIKNSSQNFFSRLGKNTPKDVSRKEDSRYVYYELDIKNAIVKNVKMKIDVNTVVISGDTTSAATGKTPDYTKFYRSFPVPSGVDGKKAELQHLADHIVIKFPKT